MKRICFGASMIRGHELPYHLPLAIIIHALRCGNREISMFCKGPMCHWDTPSMPFQSSKLQSRQQLNRQFFPIKKTTTIIPGVRPLVRLATTSRNNNNNNNNMVGTVIMPWLLNPSRTVVGKGGATPRVIALAFTFPRLRQCHSGALHRCLQIPCPSTKIFFFLTTHNPQSNKILTSIPTLRTKQTHFQ
jgi:hypothetical protein